MSNKITLNGQKERWYPASISRLECYLASLIRPVDKFPREKTYPLVKNLAYALQYVEFLHQVIVDINLSEVLLKQNIKSFVIHSASIIEALFQYLVVSTGNGSTSEWKSIKKFSSNEYHINADTFKNETEIYIKLPERIPKEMTFDQLAKKVEAKKLLGGIPSLYADISQVRKLRNRIHLHGIDSTFDTDYNNFDQSKFKLMRRVLHGVLTSSVFGESNQTTIFDYLSLS